MTTQRKPPGTRSKETSGTDTRAGEVYRRRREDSRDIGSKTYKLVE
jgi:hypothetical protein